MWILQRFILPDVYENLNAEMMIVDMARREYLEAIVLSIELTVKLVVCVRQIAEVR